MGGWNRNLRRRVWPGLSRRKPHWAAAATTPVVTVTVAAKRVSWPALIPITPGTALAESTRATTSRRGKTRRSQMVHLDRLRPAAGRRAQQTRHPLVLVWDRTAISPSAARYDRPARGPDWLTVYQLPPTAHEPSTRSSWSLSHTSKYILAGLAKRKLHQLTTATGPKPGSGGAIPAPLLDGFLASTGLDLTALRNPHH